jgi:ubiquinol-cytochrome c reductase cytochrome b subunit
MTSQSDPDNGSRTITGWTQTSGGVVAVLLVAQFVTGTLLSFYYVPSVDHAYTTVSFIEKVLSAGSWIRSVHHYGSQWLAFFLFVHVVQLYLRRKYQQNTAAWISAVLLLFLVMVEAATGYSLPWDARAFFSTRIAEGLMSGLPFVGRGLRLWLLGGDQISALTLSRFFALHVLVTPFIFISVIVWRFRRSTELSRGNLHRHAVAAAVVFLALSIWSFKNPAPIGPSATDFTTDYVPRPGAQFVWLYQALKYIPAGLGSIVGVALPVLAMALLALLPWLDTKSFRRVKNEPSRLIGAVILISFAILVVGMTVVSYLNDRRDPRTREQLARQAAAEQVFRHAPFVPEDINANGNSGAGVVSGNQPPEAYTKFCANCHGRHGEGGRQGTLRFPPLVGVATKPQRTVDDIVALLNDPASYGLEPPMRSFAAKLTEQEKREVAAWVVTLK